MFVEQELKLKTITRLSRGLTGLLNSEIVKADEHNERNVLPEKAGYKISRASGYLEDAVEKYQKRQEVALSEINEELESLQKDENLKPKEQRSQAALQKRKQELLDAFEEEVGELTEKVMVLESPIKKEELKGFIHPAFIYNDLGDFFEYE